MAFIASDRLVFSPKLESGGCVIECLHDTVLPAMVGVAALAGFTELADMRIVVAGGTLRERETNECHCTAAVVHTLFVAALAGHMEVLAGESEFRTVMHEARSRFPSVPVVALLTLACKLTLMLIVMTCQAFGGEAQVGPCVQETGILFHVRRSDVRWRMTFPAFKSPMPSFKRESGLAMVKASRIKPDKIETPTTMFFVTFRALPPNEAGMESPCRCCASAKFVMTSKAFLVCRSLS
jgi:hypothetical protein